MIRKTLLLTVLAGSLFPLAPLQAQDVAKLGAVKAKRKTAIDIIPSNAIAAVAINDFVDGEKRINAECAKLKDKNGFIGFIPQAMAMIRSAICKDTGVSECIDLESPIAFIFTGVETANDLEEGYLAFPIKDKKIAARELTASFEELTSNKVIDRTKLIKYERSPNWFGKDAFRYVLLHNDHLLFSGKAERLTDAVKRKPIRDQLLPDEIKTLTSDGLIFYVSPKNADKDDRREVNFLDEFGISGEFIDEDSPVSHASLSFRVEDGFGTTLNIHFENEDAKELLELFNDKEADTSLAYLPNGKIITANSFAGGKATPKLVSTFLQWQILKNFFGYPTKFASKRSQHNFFAIFDQIWTEINESRVALYLNDAPKTQGLMTAIAILETDDANQLLADMKSMESFVNASLLPPEEANEVAKVDDKAIAALVSELGDDKFSVRQLAMTKLKLIGERSIPALKKATKSSDRETRTRATAILDAFAKADIAQQTDALDFEPDELAKLKLQFAFLPAQEIIGGQRIDHVRIHFDQETGNGKAMAAEIPKVFGKEWNKLRFATVGDRVVIAWGAQTGLLEKTIENVKQSKPGLADMARMKSYSNRVNTKSLLQAHVSLEQIKHLINEQLAPVNTTSSTSSVGIHVEPKRIRIDFHTTIEEVQMMLNQSW